MKINSIGLIEMDQTPPPGCWGDSCAESARYVTLAKLVGSYANNVNLAQLITPNGVVRYPSPPSPWGASDTSDDQVCPLLAALELTDFGLCNKVLAQIESSSWKTGNGKLIHPVTFAQMQRCDGSRLQWLWDLAILGEALLLKYPIVVSTTKPYVSMDYSATANYLNFVNALAFARIRKWTWPCWLATRVISYKRTEMAIYSYYQPESNTGWLLQLYAAALAKIWD